MGKHSEDRGSHLMSKYSEKESKKALDAQIKFCRENNIPYFMPLNGKCFNCRRDIFEGDWGYTLEYAENNLITGCKHCNRSFVD